MINKEKDRSADIYHNHGKMITKDYFYIEEDDKLAAIEESKKVGIYKNNIPHLIKKQKNKNFSEWQSKGKTKAPHTN